MVLTLDIISIYKYIIPKASSKILQEIAGQWPEARPRRAAARVGTCLRLGWLNG